MLLLNLCEQISLLLQNLRQRISSLFGGEQAVSRWPDFEKSLPWYDQENHQDRLANIEKSKALSNNQSALLKKWSEDGYLILENQIDHSLIDQMCADVESLWTASEPFNDLRIEELKRTASAPAGLSHAELLGIPLEERLQMKARDRWRIHGFYRFSDACRNIYEDESINALCSLIFDQPALPHYSINFIYGSRQEIHQDTAVFHVFPANHLIGVWIACEDVSADSGPLVYYPKSQRSGLFKGFDNYPQTNLRTCDAKNTQLYNDHLAKVAEGYERKQFLAKKGDVLLWNGLLLHGGDAIRNMALTRKSFVCHYIPEGMDRSLEVTGPFNWG